MNKALNVKVSDHFYACELFPREAFNLEPQDFFRLITPWLRIVPERFRILIGRKVFINNWWDGGANEFGGWRPTNCKVGAAKSAHKWGIAFDPKVEGMVPPEVHEFFKKNRDKFPEITRYERLADTPNWNHYDGVFTGLPVLVEVPGK